MLFCYCSLCVAQAARATLNYTHSSAYVHKNILYILTKIHLMRCRALPNVVFFLYYSSGNAILKCHSQPRFLSATQSRCLADGIVAAAVVALSLYVIHQYTDMSASEKETRSWCTGFVVCAPEKYIEKTRKLRVCVVQSDILQCITHSMHDTAALSLEKETEKERKLHSRFQIINTNDGLCLMRCRALPFCYKIYCVSIFFCSCSFLASSSSSSRVALLLFYFIFVSCCCCCYTALCVCLMPLVVVCCVDVVVVVVVVVVVSTTRSSSAFQTNLVLLVLLSLLCCCAYVFRSRIVRATPLIIIAQNNGKYTLTITLEEQCTALLVLGRDCIDVHTQHINKIITIFFRPQQHNNIYNNNNLAALVKLNFLKFEYVHKQQQLILRKKRDFFVNFGRFDRQSSSLDRIICHSAGQ